MDNNLHNHFSEDDNLPDYLSWDNMEEGILSELDSKVVHKEKPKKKWFLLTLLLFLFFGSCSTLFYWNFDNNESLGITEKTNNVTPNNKLKEKNTTSNDKTLKASDLMNKEPNLGISNSLINHNILTKNKTNTIESIPHGYKSQEEQKPFSVSNKTALINTSGTKPVLGDANTASSSFKIKPTINKENYSDIDSNNKLEIITSTSATNVETKFRLNTKITVKKSQEEPTEATKSDNPEKKKKWSIGGGIGFTNWNPLYKGEELAKQKSNSEKGLFGYGIEGSIHYSFNKKWKISTGLEYLRFDSKLEYYSERDTSTSDFINITQISSLTGNIIGNRSEEVEINGITWRRVRHYNNYQTVSIPLLISREISSIGNKFSLDLGFGIKYTLWSHASGKNLKSGANDLIQISAIEKNDYNFSNHFSVLGDLSLNYKVKNNLSLNISSRANWYLKDVDNAINSSSQPLIFNTKIGLTLDL